MRSNKTKNLFEWVEGNHQQNEQPSTEWEKIFTSNISDKGVNIQNIYNKLMKLNINKPNLNFKKWTEDVKRHFPKEVFRCTEDMKKIAQNQ